MAMQVSWRLAVAPAAVALVVTTGPGAPAMAGNASARSRETADGGAALHMQDARVIVDGKVVVKGVSVLQTRFGFLYLYLPGRGLFVVGATDFEGAQRVGEFDGARLTAEVDGARLSLDAAGNILSVPTATAFASHDPAFTLDTQEVIFGYGDHPAPPREWLQHTR